MTILLLIFIILLAIVIWLILSVKQYITKFCKNNFGLNIKEIVTAAQNVENNTPKSISGIDNLILPEINKDFPNLNISQLKSMAETKIIECLNTIQAKEMFYSDIISDKVTAWIKSKIDDCNNVEFENIKIHKTSISKYNKSNAMATICFQTSLEYYLVKDNNSKKIQDRFQTEFIYVIDALKLDSNQKGIGLNCPNCGAPIKSLGIKKCSYCGTGVLDLVKKTWVLNNIKQY